MAPTTPITRTYPKRKRADISYLESSSDEDEVDEECVASNHNQSTAKKLRTAVSTRPLPKRKIFPFTLLPPELKNLIYKLALIDPEEIYLTSKTKHLRRTLQRSLFGGISSAGHRRKFRYPFQQSPSRSQAQSPGVSSAVTVPVIVTNILLLNKAIHTEAQPILYAGNEFALEDTMAMHTFLAIIGPKNRALLTNITIRGWGYTKAHKALNYPALTMLADAVNLTKLHFDCDITYGGPTRVAKQLYRDGFRWLEAVGAAKGSADAGVDIITLRDLNLSMNLKAFRAELRRMLQQGL